MRAGKALLGLAAGLGQGYMNQSRYQDEKARQASLDQMRQEEHDARMLDVRRQQDERVALSNAAAPAVVNEGAGGYTKPDTADNIDVGQPGEPGAEAGGLAPGVSVNGRAYPTAAEGKAAADAYNSDDATSSRISLAYRKSGDPTAGLTYGTKSLQAKTAEREYARTLQNENAVDTSRALVGGDPEEIKKAFNKSGDWKIVGDPVVKKRERDDIPGIDSLPTHDVTVTLKGPDGQTTTKTVNSYDFATHLMPYSDVLGMNIKGTQAENTADYRSALADARTTAANASATAAEAKAAALKNNPNAATREERLRWTSIFTDAGRQAVETQKTINQLQRDPLFMRNARKDANSSEAQQLAGLQATLSQHMKDREMFRGLLAGSTGGGTSSSSGAPAPTLDKAPVTVKTQADRDALPAGTLYIAPDGTKRIKQ